MTTHHDIYDVEPAFDVLQQKFDPTANSIEIKDLDTALAPLPVTVFGGGGTDNTATVNNMVRIARGELGIHESPPGSNSGPPLTRYVRYFNPNLGPCAWCAFFVSWAWDQGSDQNRRVPWSSPGAVASVHSWAQKVGRLVSSPIRGDLFGEENRHIGIVVGSDPSKHRIVTVEGNYGDKVGSASRPWSGHWFVRLY